MKGEKTFGGGSRKGKVDRKERKGVDLAKGAREKCTLREKKLRDILLQDSEGGVLDCM